MSGTPISTTGAPIEVHDLPAAAYRSMARLLRVGLAVSLLVLLGSVVAFVLKYPHATISSILAENPIQGYLTLPGLAQGLAAGAPEAYLTVGLLVLVATPIARVLCGLYWFQRNGEVAIARVTLVVLLLLLAGLLLLGPIIR